MKDACRSKDQSNTQTTETQQTQKPETPDSTYISKYQRWKTQKSKHTQPYNQKARIFRNNLSHALKPMPGRGPNIKK